MFDIIKTLKRSIIVLFFFCLWGIQIHAIPIRNSSSVDNMIATGVDLLVSSRTGVYELSGGKQQHTKDPSFAMFGLNFGKRFSLIKGARLFVPVGLHFGSVEEEVPELIPLEDGTSKVLVLKRYYLHFEFIPQFQYSFPIVEKKSFFYLSAGGGVNYMVFNEEERIRDEPNVRIIDTYLDNGNAVSMSFDCGAGVDVTLTKRRGLSFVYGFKLWQPINYGVTRDLFPVSAITYKETFFTHKLGVQFLIK